MLKLIFNKQRCWCLLFLNQGVFTYFFTLFTQDAKSSKPESAIFDFAAKKSELPELLPNQILHIGDDMDKEIIQIKKK